MSAALALLGCFGAWQAWRQNPLYASRSGSWLIAKIVLMLAAGAALITTVAVLSATWSAPAQLGALLLGIVICTLGLVFGVSAVVTPRIARVQTQVPLNAPLVQLYRRRVRGWLRVALVYFVVCGLLAPLPEPVRSMARILAALGLLVSAVMLPVGYAMARRMDRAVTALELYPWLHWQYPPEARAVWCKAQVERLKRKPPTVVLKRDWLRLLALCALVGIPALVLTSGNWIERGGWGLLCCVLMGLFIELAAAEERRAPARLARRLKATPADAWFGRDGLVCDGHFYTWIDTSVYLRSAHIDWRPPRSVCFVFANLGAGAYGAPAMRCITQSVLIPPTAAANELLLLQQQLRNRCPNAEIKLA